MPSPPTPHAPLELHPGPAVAAWIYPGLGHILIGEPKRGLIVMISLTFLFVCGLLIGGVDSIDYRTQKLWFAGQCLFSPVAPAMGYYHETLDRNMVQRIEAYQLDQRRNHQRNLDEDDALLEILRTNPHSLPYIKSTGRVNEMGTLYCAMAGLLNLLAIIDVFARPRRANPQADRGQLVTREDA